MDMQVGDDQILVYDMRFALINRHQKNPFVSQTVISIRPPELELPLVHPSASQTAGWRVPGGKCHQDWNRTR